MAIFLGPQVPNPPVLRPQQVFTISWTAPGTGRVTQFDARGLTPEQFITLPGVAGFDMPVFTAYKDTSPGYDGEINRGFRKEARDVSIPIDMTAPDRATYKQMRNDLFTDLNPRDGVPGTLTVTDVDGTTRSLTCFYASGLEGALDDVKQGQSWMQATIDFHAPDPDWLGIEIAPAASSNPDPTTVKGWFPFLPIQLSSTQVLGRTSVTNMGQGDAYPMFVITGPCTSVHLTNLTSGLSIDIDQALSTTDTMTISCTPGSKSVYMNGSTNLLPKLDLTLETQDLWPLKQGVNDVDFELAGLSTATTLSFTYRERYLAAW